MPRRPDHQLVMRMPSVMLPCCFNVTPTPDAKMLVGRKRPTYSANSSCVWATAARCTPHATPRSTKTVERIRRRACSEYVRADLLMPGVLRDYCPTKYKRSQQVLGRSPDPRSGERICRAPPPLTYQNEHE